MKKEVKKKIIGHHETRRELFRDIIACVIIAYVAVLAFLLVDARIKYTNAMTDHISSQINVTHAAATVMD